MDNSLPNIKAVLVLIVEQILWPAYDQGRFNNNAETSRY